MNKRREVERHLTEAKLHLRIAGEYLGGFDDYHEKLEITNALASIKKLTDKYMLEDIKEHEDAM